MYKRKKKIGELSSLKWIAECQKVPLPNKPLKTAVMINIERVFQKLMTDSSSQQSISTRNLKSCSFFNNRVSCKRYEKVLTLFYLVEYLQGVNNNPGWSCSSLVTHYSMSGKEPVGNNYPKCLPSKRWYLKYKNSLWFKQKV